MEVFVRVLLVADVSAEQVLGGAERMLVHHVRALMQSKHDLTILTRQPQPDAPLKIDLGEGVSEHRLAFSGDKGPRGLMQLRREAGIWWRQHKDEFDLVVGEQPFVMWALLRAGCRLPRLQVCHSFAFQEYATRHGLDWGLKHRLITAAMRHLETGIYSTATRMLVLSQHMRRELDAYFDIPEARVVLAPGGVDLPPVPDEEERASVRKELGWQGPVVVTLRNLVPRTGVDLLVQAAAIVRRVRPDVRWSVMGSGALTEPLKWIAAQLKVDDIIEFTGYLSEEDVVRRMQAADAFMLPTRSLEGFGLVTIEANACGLPVVATPVGGNVEVASSSPDNQLAAATSPEALAEAMLELLAEPMDHAMRARRLRAHIAKHFSWPAHDAYFMAAIGELA
ncbi:MAG: glycosyltransferase family 4 protein [Mariprofundaceae bacterium]|nr:glycosyltransferase family 4 protein [Mariprofundaceae bacterium]